MGMAKKLVARSMSVAMFALVALFVVLLAVSVDAENPPVRLVGAVQWIGGLGMALALDTRGSIRIDLASVELTDYQGLTSGGRGIVTGGLSVRRGRVIATAIARAPWRLLQPQARRRGRRALARSDRLLDARSEPPAGGGARPVNTARCAICLCAVSTRTAPAYGPAVHRSTANSR